MNNDKRKKVKHLINLVEAYTGKKIFFEAFESDYAQNKTKTVAMTTKELERNPQQVDKIAKKGFDVKLTDLKENEDQLEDIENEEEIIFDTGDIKDFAKTVEDDRFFVDDSDDFFYDDDDDDDFLLESENKKTVDFSGELSKLIKKIYTANDKNWNKVKATIEGAWKQVQNQGGTIPNNNKPLPLKK